MGGTSAVSARYKDEQPSASKSSAKNFRILYEYPDEGIEKAWRQCLNNGDMPTHFASPEYFREPRTESEQRFAVLAVDPQSSELRVLGALTGVRVDKRVTSGQIGTPQICVDKSVDPQEAGTALADGLRAVAKSADLINVFSWFSVDALTESGFRLSETSGTAALDLRGGAKKTFSKLKGRSQVRHAISAGVEVRQATPDDLPDYYSILKDWSTRKGIPCPSLELLRKFFELTNNRRLFLAVYQGTIIAGTPVRFYPGATAEYAWNASRPEVQHLRPNDLLHWRIIEWACEQGIQTYLLGATHQFLLKYSDRIIPTYRHFQDRTAFRIHTLREGLAGAAVNAYRRLPPVLKERLKGLRAR